MEVDHIVSILNRGTNDPSNLWSLCRACHRDKTHSARKSHASLERFVAPLKAAGFSARVEWCADCKGHQLRIDRAPEAPV